MSRSQLLPSLGVLAGLWCAGCYYDSRWGESTRSQQRVAEARTPEELSAASGGPSAGRASECNVELDMRVYDASSVGPGASRRAFEQVVARANEVLTPDMACLTVREVRPWKQASATAPLAEQLAELRALDAGADVDLVVGLSPAAELLPFSFSQLGVAEVLGKHLVLRSASDARELEAIERALPDLDAEARRELYAKRKLHKATASLLHELGHALGAIHTTRRDELMHPMYGIEMKGFSEPTRALLRVSLESRQATGESGSSGTLAARMLNLLKGTPSGTWNADELDARVKALERLAAAAPNADSGAGQTQQSKSAPVPGLAPSDEAAYREATGLLDAKQPKEAWDRAKPLFDRYAESYEVQDLRCRIAMQLGLAWDATRKECDALMRLTGASTAPETAR